MNLAAWIARKFGKLKVEVYALYLACRDPRVPWYAKAVAACVVGYALSPIDLIPDFIPFVGYLDDIVIVPLGVKLAVSLVPKEILRECRSQAAATFDESKRKRSWIAGIVIIAIWLAVLAWIVSLLIRAFRR